MTMDVPEMTKEADLGVVVLGHPRSNKRREFMFDHCFDPSTSQEVVFDVIARPIVDDVLKGMNGTVFAYGQTGTGKTYTMGILQTIKSANSRDAGVVPRALQQIFSHRGEKSLTMEVTMSFIQIYCETIQDLLAPAMDYSGENEAIGNLQIREDPGKGFYVKGLTEYKITSYSEAEGLINLGLENRAMAPTLMNVTSSRSHTVLTVKVVFVGTGVKRSGKLLLVDLAGSERIRRTTSSGVRLSEARSINASLSALGNVIAALAVDNKHVPFRDSKLTRLLQDSLGGSASTALIATVGPAPVNESESLSTLMFASRCMHVKSQPVFNEEIDYMDMCAKLQVQLASADQTYLKKLSVESEKYETIIHKLATELKSVRVGEGGRSSSYGGGGGGGETAAKRRGGRRSSFSTSAAVDTIGIVRSIGKGGGFGKENHDGVLGGLNLSYKMLCQCADESSTAVSKFFKWVGIQMEELKAKEKREEAGEEIRVVEAERMNENDTLGAGLKKSLGPHLQPLSKKESRSRVEARFEGIELVDMKPTLMEGNHPELSEFENVEALMSYSEKLLACIRSNGEKLELGLWQTTEWFLNVKEELVSVNVERRGREEEVVNWSFVLKYLLSTNSKLRRKLAGRGGGGGGRGGIFAGAGDPNALNTRTKMAVMEDLEDEAAAKIQAGFRRMAVGDDGDDDLDDGDARSEEREREGAAGDSLVGTPKIIAGAAQTPRT
ncbi:hypothetical protein TrRE_jg76, partial [Triparma retinervis]